MKIRVLVNGIEATTFNLTIHKEADVYGFCGDIHAVFADGSELQGRIKREITIRELHPLQHIYELEFPIGRIAIEYIDDESQNLVT